MTAKFDRISITYKLSFETPFHCGTGLREGLIDRTIVRDHDDFLYMPGSTIKGVVREHCERLARMYSDENDAVMRDLIASPHDGKKALFALGRHTSMITRIFGSHYAPGHLFFEDARQEDTDKEQYKKGGGADGYKDLQTELYTQVRLDRPTRTAVAGALYTSEFGTKDVILHGSITGWLRCTPIAGVEEGPTYSLLLLLAGLHLVDRIGGNKSAGKGKCRCEVGKVTVNGKDYEKDDWQPWFNHLDKLADYTKVGADLEVEEE